jgi:hypothetical protein
MGPGGPACSLGVVLPFAAAGAAAALGAGAHQRDGDVVGAACLDRRLPQFEHCPAILVLAEHLVEHVGGHGIGQAVGADEVAGVFGELSSESDEVTR